MKIIINNTVAVITGAILAGFMNIAFAQQTITKTLMHDKVLRSYILYIPAKYTGNSPVPLLFNFHGRTMSAADQMKMCDFRPVADTAGFILVHPQGTLFGGFTAWNVGGFTLGMTADDIGFTEAMIDTIASAYRINLNKVYSAGFSNGGYFSFELACKVGNRIAAIASVGGSMTPETYNNCNPVHPTPVIQIHGTSDPVVYYYGITWSKPVPDALSYWVAYNNANPVPAVSGLPDLNPADGSTVEYYAYKNGNRCSSVEHYKVNGGLHSWPKTGGIASIQNVDFDASTTIWNFVSKYDINGKIGCTTTGINEFRSDPGRFEVFPNPSAGRITILLPPETTEIIITDLTGQQILRTLTSRENVNLTLDRSGVFIVYVKTKKGMLTRKLVVRR